MRKVELHVGSEFLKLVKELLRRRAHNVVNFDYLVHFIVAREEREEAKDFKHNTPDSPKIHLVAIVSVGE